jgi:hypothetical protein
MLNRPRRRTRAAAMLVAVIALVACGRIARELRKVEPLQLNSATIRGRVVDIRTGAAIIGATLTLLDPAADSLMPPPVAASFPPDGTFRHSSVRPGCYRIRAQAPQYAPLVSDAVCVQIGDVFSLVLQLTPS